MPHALDHIPLACPLDGLALVRSGNAFRCAQGHSYDLSSAGYVNLLPVQFKSSKNPGDPKDMVKARRTALDSGVFQPIADRAVDHVEACLQTCDEDVPLLVDAGCGDGYYTDYLRKHLSAVSINCLGADISKWAVIAAAKRHKTMAWAVASNKCLPVLRGRADIITSLFGFETWHPWAGLQKPGQWVVVADAGPRHLLELRQVIYETVRQHDPPCDQAARDAGYRKTDQSHLSVVKDHVPEDLWLALLEMTPHGRRIDPGRRERLGTLHNTSLTLDIVFRVYQRL